MEPLISACMMVKNEEASLERCLSSLAGLVDEICVVDTGSADRTIEIAKKFGAKVIESPWREDFSYHRNESIAMASGKWIFIVDADEEVFCSNKPAFREILTKLTPEHKAVSIDVMDHTDGIISSTFTSGRFFRNGEIHYEGIVHNRPVFPGNSAVYKREIAIHHYGYDLSKEKMDAKFNRTVGLLKKRLEKDPNDWICYFYLSQMYATREMTAEAVEAGETYLAHREELGKNRSFNPTVFFTVIHGHIRLGNRKKAGQWLKEAVIYSPDELDTNFTMVEYGLWTNRLDLVIEGGKRYLEKYRSFKTDPLRDSRFVFSHNSKALCFVTMNLTINLIREGFKSFQILQNALGQTDEAHIKEVLAVLERELGPLGICFKVIDEKKERKGSTDHVEGNVRSVQQDQREAATLPLPG